MDEESEDVDSGSGETADSGAETADDVDVIEELRKFLKERKEDDGVDETDIEETRASELAPPIGAIGRGRVGRVYQQGSEVWAGRTRRRLGRS